MKENVEYILSYKFFFMLLTKANPCHFNMKDMKEIIRKKKRNHYKYKMM